MLPFSSNLQAKQPLNEKGKVIFDFEVYIKTKTKGSINLNKTKDNL
jgi:hypothetical protein